MSRREREVERKRAAALKRSNERFKELLKDKEFLAMFIVSIVLIVATAGVGAAVAGGFLAADGVIAGVDLAVGAEAGIEAGEATETTVLLSESSSVFEEVDLAATGMNAVMQSGYMAVATDATVSSMIAASPAAVVVASTVTAVDAAMVSGTIAAGAELLTANTLAVETVATVTTSTIQYIQPSLLGSAWALLTGEILTASEVEALNRSINVIMKTSELGLSLNSASSQSVPHSDPKDSGLLIISNNESGLTQILSKVRAVGVYYESAEKFWRGAYSVMSLF